MYRVEGGSITATYAGANLTLDTNINKLTVGNIDHFSDWFVGNAPSGIADWMLMH